MLISSQKMRSMKEYAGLFVNQSKLLKQLCKIKCQIIINWLISRETLKAEDKIENPANFGAKCSRHCICEVPGQLPCPALIPLPNSWRGKYKFQKPDEL